MRLIKLVSIALLIISAMTLLIACESKPKTSVLKEPTTVVGRYDFSVVTTGGNHSYIPLNIDGNPANHVGEILGALEAFEKAYPKLEVTDWKIEKQQRSYTTYSYIYGIWIDHKPVQ